MGFWKKLFSGGQTARKDETNEAIFIYSQCDKCQEKFRNRIDKQYDLMATYADEGPAYRSHKELIGGKCHNKLIVDLEFDQQKHLRSKNIQHGRFITREEFEGQEATASQDES
ncbi:hypothetical protein CSA56_14440 [candidate division KSB3 bacterium]|uniref:Uncharacterized protein n=1 Tax=candidate division KSB3 bacterium TaxID=2044937 RepID=A0A2G6KAJ7_9BACT|nr:MAG: hypothetical protein CSA56_14440 [candidate division KSB3 bacterium]